MNQIQDIVKTYYGETLSTSNDLKTDACTTADRPPPHAACGTRCKLLTRAGADRTGGTQPAGASRDPGRPNDPSTPPARSSSESETAWS